MNSIILSAGVMGIDTYPVEVQVDVSRGLSKFEIVGLPENSVREGKSRIDSALRNSGFDFKSNLKVRVNLSPSTIKKMGSAYDLPIALGILKSRGLIQHKISKRVMVAGELSLDGEIKSICGSLMITTKAKELGLEGVVLPKANLEEVKEIDGIDIYGVSNLAQAVGFLNGEGCVNKFIAKVISKQLIDRFDVDFKDVRGQEGVKRAVQVGVAGAHNMLMVGPPGCGKSMIAKRIPEILPDMNYNEKLETTKIYNSLGIVPKGGGLFKKRPFRSPHHTISYAGMVGGNRLPRPGELSLANNGVLFLDEFSEFKKHILEVMRQPLEDGYVVISRALGSFKFPCKVMLIAAMNPCPCGYLGDNQKICECSSAELSKHLRKLSGPILDRIDMHIDVPRIDFKNISSKKRGLSSGEMKENIMKAHEIQTRRFRGSSVVYNAHMSDSMMDDYCRVDAEAMRLLETAMAKMALSARGYSKILKLSRTIADLEGCEGVHSSHIAEAIHYRLLDRRLKF